MSSARDLWKSPGWLYQTKANAIIDLLGTASAAGATTITVPDAATNAVTDELLLLHTSSGTVTAGFGAGVSFQLEDASGNAAQEAGSIDVAWTTATHGSEAADMIFSVAQTDGTVNALLTLDASADAVVVAGGVTATGTVDGALLTGPHRHDVQELTATGAFTLGSGLALLNHATVVIAATLAAPVAGDELYIVDSSASGTAAHTVTTAAGVTWDGTNNTATLNAPGEALHVIALSATRWFILENIGSVALSSV